MDHNFSDALSIVYQMLLEKVGKMFVLIDPLFRLKGPVFPIERTPGLLFLKS